MAEINQTDKTEYIAYFIDGVAKGTSVELDIVRDVLVASGFNESTDTEYYRLVAGGVEDNILYFSTNPTDSAEVNRKMMKLLGEFIINSIDEIQKVDSPNEEGYTGITYLE